MPRQLEINIPADSSPVRIDSWLVAQPEVGLSRSYIQHLMEQGDILLNGKPVKSSHKISPGETVYLTIPDPQPMEVKPENIPLDVVYEDEHFAIINKPAGMVVHPACGNYTGTLVHALLYHFEALSGIGGVQRPGIVHRLDKGTSGLIAVAKTDLAHHSLSGQLKTRTLSRRYVALVKGHFHGEDGYIETQIGRHPADRKRMTVLKEGGRVAGTFYKSLESYQKKLGSETLPFSYVECKLTTGRTHQIRVHLSYLSHPVLGDDIYGGLTDARFTNKMKDLMEALQGIALHARIMGLKHPATQEYMEFTREPGPAFQSLKEFLSQP